MGRKKVILWGTTIMSVGVIIKASSYHLAQMIIGRIVLGIGNGLNTATAPVWQTETASAKWRGKLVILEMMMNINSRVLAISPANPECGISRVDVSYH